MLPGIQHRVVDEVGWRVRLIGGHQLHERIAAHRLQRIVRSALFPDRRKRLRAQRFAAERSGAVRGVHQAVVRERQELRPQRVVQQVAERGGRPAKRCAKVRAADVADEQGIPREHGVRMGGAAIADRTPAARWIRACGQVSRAPRCARGRGRSHRGPASARNGYSALAFAPRQMMAPVRSRSSR